MAKRSRNVNRPPGKGATSKPEEMASPPARTVDPNAPEGRAIIRVLRCELGQRGFGHVKPLHDVCNDIREKLPDNVRPVCATEPKRYANYFAEVEIASPLLPQVPENQPLRYVDFELREMTAQSLEEQALEVFKCVPEHRRCPVCFNLEDGVPRGLMGKSQRKQRGWHRVSGRAVKISYVCDACAYQFTYQVNTTRVLVSDAGEVLLEDPQVDHS